MREQDIQKLMRLEGCDAPRPLILTSRRFRRPANFGMKIWRSATRNFDYDLEIEHVEIACPGYKLTDNGPMMDRD